MKRLINHLLRLPTAPSAAAAPTSPACIASSALFGDRSEVVIEHNGERYRLRITRQNKLILTK